MDVVELINKYGFPIVAAGGMGYLIYYVWEWATKEIKPVLGEANTTLIALIDRIRMLDNDLIRMQQKVNTVLHLRGKIIESDRVMESQKVDAEADKKFKKALLEEGAGAEKKTTEEENKKDKAFLAKDNG
jgi:IMP dehydrogenase/GMP reductase